MAICEINFPGHEKIFNYYRELDLEHAAVLSRYTVDDVTYETRSDLPSFQDQVIAGRITSDKKGALNFSVTMDSSSAAEVVIQGNDELIVSGVTSDFEGVKGAVNYCARIKILTRGGSVTARDTVLTVSGANEAPVYVSIAPILSIL